MLFRAGVSDPRKLRRLRSTPRLLRTHASVSAYLKFWIPSLVPEKECVYLDVDAIVLSDVAECKAHAPKLPCTISAVLNRQTVREMDGNFRKLHEYYALPSGLYFNTGLMVMNLEALRRSRWTEKCCEVVHAHPTLMVHKDQDAINAVHNHLTQSMPARFNYHDFSTNGYQLGSPFYQAALRLGLCYASLTAGENVVELAEKMYDAALPSNVFLLHYSSAPKPWVPKGYLCRQHSWHWFAMAREALPAAEFSAFFSCAKLRAAFLWRRAYFNAGRDRALVKGVRRLAWGSAPLFGV